jgi:1,2-diacylglycerol 3-beta-glucosyltransferase
MAITGIRWQEEAGRAGSATLPEDQASLARRGLRLLRSERRYTWVLLAMAGGTGLAVAVVGLPTVGSLVGSILLILFVAYFVRHFSFAVAALRSGPADLEAAALPLLEDPARLPSVSVLVACKNEEAVVDRLIGALLALDYPRDRLEWIVVDDGSVDGTGRRLDQEAARTPRFTVLHRPRGSTGGKSGALNEALGIAAGEIVVVFDADHRPRPDTIRRMVRHFSHPKVAAVQGRCVIANADDSPLASLVALDYYGGYLVNEYGRQAVGGLPAYGGANGAVRASLLRSMGGWNEDSVTEDTDLTLRLLLQGHRVAYDVTAVDEEEGVVTFRRFWRQRYRWARGHQQCWRDYRRAVWQSPHLGLAEKVETTMFLYAFHMPAVAALGLVVMVLWGLGIASPAAASLLFVYTMMLFLGPLVEIGGGMILADESKRSAVSLAWFLPLFFVSMAICTKAWFDGILGRQYAWVKTARSGEHRPVHGRHVAGAGAHRRIAGASAFAALPDEVA